MLSDVGFTWENNWGGMIGSKAFPKLRGLFRDACSDGSNTDT